MVLYRATESTMLLSLGLAVGVQSLGLTGAFFRTICCTQDMPHKYATNPHTPKNRLCKFGKKNPSPNITMYHANDEG